MTRFYAALVVVGGAVTVAGVWLLLPAAGVVVLGVLLMVGGVQALGDDR